MEEILTFSVDFNYVSRECFSCESPVVLMELRKTCCLWFSYCGKSNNKKTRV